MESAPKEREQPRFESAPESLRPGNILTYHREEDGNGYFVSQFGWKVETLPEGTEIKTKSFTMVVGVSMPESTGTVVHRNGKTLFIATGGFASGFESKFFDRDVVEIVSLPETETSA